MRQPSQQTFVSGLIRRAAVLTSVAFLSGCTAGTPGNGLRDDGTSTPAADAVQVIERDVEAPEIFSTQGRALWDGRPSLGGIWIAAPDVASPERVVIRDRQTGASVVGALFRRERDNSGPALQLSSEAAAALGVLAGTPTDVEVVALRREEADPPVARGETGSVVQTTATDGPGSGLRITAVKTLFGKRRSNLRDRTRPGTPVNRFMEGGDAPATVGTRRQASPISMP